MNDGGRQAGYRVCVLLMNLCVEERRLLGGTSVEVSGRTFNSSGPVVGKTAEYHVRVVITQQ